MAQAITSRTLPASHVTIPLFGQPTAFIFPNGAFAAVEERLGMTLVQAWQSGALLSPAVLTTVIVAGVNAAAKWQGRDERVTEADVRDGLLAEDMGQIIELTIAAIAGALGLNLPNGWAPALRGQVEAMFADVVAGLTTTSLTPSEPTSSPTATP
jgi:hypothetical protein